jgi:cytoskeletal protein CcmA (bactofilin family)
MAQSYTRQSTFVDGDTITAALFNDEYSQLVNAFTYSSSSATTTGHRHDGTAGHGGNVHTIGDLDFLNKIVVDSTNNRWGFFVEVSSSAVEQIRIQDGAVVPVTDNDIDLGTSSLEFKDLFIDGTAHVDTLDVDANATIAGTLGVTGVLTGTSLDISGDIDIDGTTNLDVVDIDGAVDMASTLAVTGVISPTTHVDMPDSANIKLGTGDDLQLYHDGTNSYITNATGALKVATETSGIAVTIGHTTSETTVADNLTVTGNAAVGGNLTVTGTTTFNGGTITMGDAASDNVVFGADINSSIIPNTDDTYDLGSSSQQWRNAYIDGTAYVDTLDLAGTAVTSTAAELNLLDGVTSTTAELNILDGVTASAADINLIDGITNGTVIASKVIITDSNKDITGGRNITISGELDAATLDISGDADIDGTLEADAITIAGVTLAETIADTVGAMVTSNTESGVTVAYQDADNTIDFTVGTLNQDTTGTAALATSVTVTANNSTDETVYPIFVDGATGTQGAESDTGLTYNPSTGMLTSTGVTSTFTGNITGNVTGNTSGTAATVTTAAQSNITSLGTLTTLTVDNVIINGSTIGHTGDTDLITVASGIATVAGEVSMTTLDIGGTNVTSTAAELNILDGVTSTAAEINALDGITAVVGELNALDIGSTAVGTAVASKAVILDSNKDYTGLRNLTITGELDAATLDISGNVDIDGVLETDNLTVGGAQGTDGQVLTSTGSGVGWEDAGTGATFKTFGTSSIMIGDNATGTIDAANYNTGVGIDIFAALTTGDNNTALGFSALAANTTGANNTAVGKSSLLANTTGASNTAVGEGALTANTTAANNTAVGMGSLGANTTGANSVAVGFEALSSNTTQTRNVAVGYHALEECTADDNTAVGTQALQDNTTGYYNVALGYLAAGAITTGNSNTAIGSFALDAATTASNNTAVGTAALGANTTGSENTAVGQGALDANTTASGNTAFGSDSLTANTTGASNTGLGKNALEANTTASNNTAIGHGSLVANTTGAYNTALGSSAGYGITTGDGNTVLGGLAAHDTVSLTTGTNNTVLGMQARTSIANADNQIVIGYNFTGNGDNKVNLGSSGGYVWNAFTANNTWTQVSDERTKKNIESDDLGLNFINELRPVIFNWRHSTEIDPEFIEETVNIGRGEKDTETLIHGLIAQEVKAAMDSVGNTTFNGWEEGQDGQAVSREMFITPLIKAVQELSIKVDDLTEKLNNCNCE